MSEYQYTTTETEAEHAEREGEDLTTEEISWCKQCNSESSEACNAHASAIAVETVLQICSCGYGTCPMISRFGLPVPIFVDDIEPIPTQPARDRRAVELRGARAEAVKGDAS